MNNKSVYLGIEQSFDKTGFVVTGCDGKHGLESEEFYRLVCILRDRLPHSLYGENRITIFDDANDLYRELRRSVTRLYFDDKYDIFIRPLGATRGRRT